tara:strand:- start:994 stop:1620 length:627 start_codon:yes stop_codon:yes gene_type:complete
MKQIEVLPQTIYEFEADPRITATALELLKKEKLIHQKHSTTHDISGMTEDARLDLRPEYAPIMDWIRVCLDEVKIARKLQCDCIDITQSWGVVTTYNTHQPKHFHTNSYISGVFYLTDSPTGTMIYHTSIWEREEQPMVTVRNLDHDSDVSHKCRAKAGTLSLFPSNTFHQVKPSKDFNDRYSLVVNTFPTGRIGHYRSFNGMEIDIK